MSVTPPRLRFVMYISVPLICRVPILLLVLSNLLSLRSMMTWFHMSVFGILHTHRKFLGPRDVFPHRKRVYCNHHTECSSAPAILYMCLHYFFLNGSKTLVIDELSCSTHLYSPQEKKMGGLLPLNSKFDFVKTPLVGQHVIYVLRYTVWWVKHCCARSESTDT